MWRSPDFLASCVSSVCCTQDGPDARRPMAPGSMTTTVLLPRITNSSVLLQGMLKISVDVLHNSLRANPKKNNPAVISMALLFALRVRGCAIIMSAKMGGTTKIHHGGWENAINMPGGYHFKMVSQILVSRSSAHAINPFGMCKSCAKKSSDARDKNTVKKGEKTKLPIGDNNEMGNPHQTKIGSDMQVRKSCRTMKVCNLYAVRCAKFCIPISFIIRGNYYF